MEPPSAHSVFPSKSLELLSQTLQKPVKNSKNETFPGCFEDDLCFDKILANLVRLNVVDSEGKLDRQEFFPTPPLAQAQIDALFKFYSQTVPYFSAFDEKQREAARAYFASPEKIAKAQQESSEAGLQVFLNSTLLRGKGKDIQYFICLQELVQELYNFSMLDIVQSGNTRPAIAVEIIGGHGRQILHQATAETKSWAETFFEIIVKRPLRQIVPESVIEKFKQNPFDSDNRWIIPQASLELLDRLRCRVAEFIAKQIATQYPEYHDKRLFAYLIEFVKKFGLEKFMLVNTVENKFSLVNFGQKSYKNFEFIFVHQLARTCMFTLDAFKIPIMPLIEFAYSNSFRGIQPRTGYKDAQCLIDQYTYLLDCPDIASAGPFVFFGGVLHQCKGARYSSAEQESILLSKVLSLCELRTTTTQGSGRRTKKYDAGLTVEVFANHMQKHLKNHAKNEINAYITFVLRTLTVLEKHEKDIPRSVARLLWNRLTIHFKNCQSSQSKLFFDVAAALDELNGDFSTLYPFLQIVVFIFLCHSRSDKSSFKAYITTNSGQSSFQLESEYILLMPCEVNETISSLHLKMNEKSNRALGRLLGLMSPSHIVDFNAETPVKQHFNRLNIDLALLEKQGALFVRSELLTLKRIGIHLLFCCFSLSKSTLLIPLILEAIPSLLAAEKRKSIQELLLEQCEHLLQYVAWVPLNYTFSLTRAYIAEFYKQVRTRAEFLPANSLATDLISTSHLQLEVIGWKMWNELQTALVKNKRKDSGIRFIQTFAAKTHLAICALRLLINDSTLSESDVISLFELILKNRIANREHLLALFSTGKEVVSRLSSSAQSARALSGSHEVPRLLEELLDANFFEETLELANLYLEGSVVLSENTKFVNLWIRICKHHLAIPEKVDVGIELFEKGQRLALFDPKATVPAIVDLQIEIVRQLVSRAPERNEKKLLYYVAFLAEKSLDSETKNLLRNIIWTRFFQSSAAPDWQTIERETKRYKTLFDHGSLMDFKIEALRKSVATSNSPLACMHLVRHILIQFNGEPACVDVLFVLVLNLCESAAASQKQEEYLDEALFLLNHAKIKKFFVPAIWQKCVIAYVSASGTASKKHQFNGQHLTAQLLASGKPGYNKDEASKLTQFMLAQTRTETVSASSFSRVIESNFDTVLALSEFSGLQSAVIHLFEHLLNLKLTIPISEKKIAVLHKAFMDETKEVFTKLPDYERLISGLKWFVKSDLYPAEQLALYCDLINALVKTGDTHTKLRWLKRLFNYFADLLDGRHSLYWIQGLDLKTCHMADARELFSILKSCQKMEYKLQSRLLFALLEALDRAGCSDLDSLLIHSSSLLADYKDKPLLTRCISRLMDEATSSSSARAVQLVTAYGLFNRSLCTTIFEKFAESPYLAPLGLVCGHWPLFQLSLEETLRHRFWRIVLKSELTPESSLLITVLDTLPRESATFISTLLPEIISINLKDFPRQTRLLEAISTLTHLAETPSGPPAKKLILSLDLSSELHLSLAYKCFSSAQWQWEDIPVMLIPFIKNSKRLSLEQRAYIATCIKVHLRANAKFCPEFTELFRQLVIHHEDFEFEIFQLALQHIREFDPNGKESLRQTILFAQQTRLHYLALRILDETSSDFTPEERLSYIINSATSLLFSESVASIPQVRLANAMVNREVATCRAKELKRDLVDKYVPYMLMPMGELHSPLYAHECLLRLQESFFNISLVEHLPKGTFHDEFVEMREEESLHQYCSIVRSEKTTGKELDVSPFYSSEALASLKRVCTEDPDNYFHFHHIIIAHILKCRYNNNIKNYTLLQLAKQLLYCLLNMRHELSCYRSQIEDILLKFIFWGALSTSILFQEHLDFLSSIIDFAEKGGMDLDTSFLALYTGCIGAAEVRQISEPSKQIMSFIRKIYCLLAIDDPEEPQFFCFGVHALDLFCLCQRSSEIELTQDETQEIISLIALNAAKQPFIFIKKEGGETFIKRVMHAANPNTSKVFYFSTIVQLFVHTACSAASNSRFFGSAMSSGEAQVFGPQHLFMESLSLITTISKKPLVNTSISREICSALLFIITNLKSLENIHTQTEIFMTLATPFFKHFDSLHLEKDRVVSLLVSNIIIDLFSWETQGRTITPSANASRTSYILIWLKCFISYYDRLPIEKFIVLTSPHINADDKLYEVATHHLNLPVGSLAAKQQFYAQIERIAEFVCSFSLMEEQNITSPAKCIDYVRKRIHKRKGEAQDTVTAYHPDNLKIRQS